LIINLLLLGLTARAGPTVVSSGEVDETRANALLHGQRVALVVGPSSFEPDFAPLRFTDDDAISLGEVLSDPAVGHFDRVWTLTEPEDTSLAAVRTTMNEIAAYAKSPDDTVVVYFSTHGTLDGPPTRLDQYLVLSDTKLESVSASALGHDEVLTWLDHLPSRRKVLVLATCHSGQGKSAFPPRIQAVADSTKGTFIPPLRDVSEATVVIGVCAFDETARESESLGHDIYTAFFLDALRDGDANGDGAVTVTEAHAAARDKTWEYTKGTQRPYARAEIVGSDPIVLSGDRIRAGRPSLGSYLLRYVGFTVEVDGEEKGALPGELIIEPGKHLIEVRAPGDGPIVARQRVRLSEGARVELNELVRNDRVRLAVGFGGQLFGSPLPGAPIGRSEIHVPWLPGGGWELIVSGGASARWPRPTLDSALTVERALTPGPLQFRLGGGLHAYVLGAPKKGANILAPTLVPEPIAAIVFLPKEPIVIRFSVGGGYLWYADRGEWNHNWTGHSSLVVGAAY